MTDAFLANLDNLLSEFYSVSSDNARKAQIEQDLRNLKNADNCWECCVQLLQQSQSQYSQWWALSTLEEYIARKWSTISEKYGNDLREFLYTGALRDNQVQFITIKYIKVFVNIGIRQWKSNDTFFKQIMQFVVNTSNVASQETGVSMIQVLSEELNRARVDIHWELYHTSKEKLNEQIPTILTTLTTILDKHISSPDRNTKLCSSILQCLSHLLSWISLTEILTPGLLNTVFACAKDGVDGSCELGAHAMSCINEIVRRNMVPAQVEEFVLQLFQQTLSLLTIVTQRDVSDIDSGYLKKLIEFLNLFTSGHLRRVESNASFPILEFLFLLFKFTESQTDPDLFSGTIDVCSSWVDFLLSVQGSLSPDGTVSRYGEALTTLAQLIVSKSRYHSNGPMLDEIDDTLTDSETKEICHTEWDMFLGKLTQLLSKIIELYPTRISVILIKLLGEHCTGFYQLQSCVKMEANGMRVEGMDSDAFYKALRDIASVMYLTQLTVPSLVGDNFARGQDTTQGILFHAMKCIDITARVTQKYPGGTSCPLKRGHSQILESSVCVLSTFSQWFLLFGQANPSQYPNMVSSVLDSVLPSFDYQTEARLQQCVVDLMYKVVVVCRPVCLLSVSSVQSLYQNTIAGRYTTYSATARNTLQKALTLAIVLPWIHVADQQWDVRDQHFQQFVQGMFSPLLRIGASDIEGSASNLAQHTPTLTHYLATLSDTVGCIAHRETKSKQIVCQAVLPIVRHLITLLPLFQKDSKIFEHVLSFTTVLCDALRVQLGAQFLQELVGLCLSNFTKTKGSSSEMARTTIEKFIELLTTVVREPSSIFKTFTPDIIKITLHEIRECVSRMDSLNSVYCYLVHSIIDFKWNYFYPRGAQDREFCHHQDEFLVFFQPFGESLLKPDFNLIKQNVAALTDLNDKHELFIKQVFVMQLKPTFIRVLLSLSFSGSVPIIDEELEDVLYQLSQNRLESTSGAVYLTVLSEYLASVLPGGELHNVLSALEVPSNAASFKINMRFLVNKIKFLVNCAN